MRRLATALLVALTATPALAQATKEPVALRDFGLSLGAVALARLSRGYGGTLDVAR